MTPVAAAERRAFGCSAVLLISSVHFSFASSNSFDSLGNCLKNATGENKKSLFTEENQKVYLQKESEASRRRRVNTRRVNSRRVNSRRR